MCGGTDVIKQDGVFVCQSCGVKYSLEDAKKMMVEVTGKIETGPGVENLLEAAKQAFRSRDYSLAYNRFAEVQNYRPKDIYATEMLKLSNYLKQLAGLSESPVFLDGGQCEMVTRADELQQYIQRFPRIQIEQMEITNEETIDLYFNTLSATVLIMSKLVYIEGMYDKQFQHDVRIRIAKVTWSYEIVDCFSGLAVVTDFLWGWADANSQLLWSFKTIEKEIQDFYWTVKAFNEKHKTYNAWTRLFDLIEFKEKNIPLIVENALDLVTYYYDGNNSVYNIVDPIDYSDKSLKFDFLSIQEYKGNYKYEKQCECFIDVCKLLKTENCDEQNAVIVAIEDFIRDDLIEKTRKSNEIHFERELFPDKYEISAKDIEKEKWFIPCQNKRIFNIHQFLSEYAVPMSKEMQLLFEEYKNDWFNYKSNPRAKQIVLEKVRQEKRANRSCFITTAVCAAQNKPDDCYELTTFRAFRDNWLTQTPEGQAAIQEYYDIAPRIVEGIDKRRDARKIYDGIYSEYLLPCLSLIEAGDNQACFEKYKKMVDKLRRYAKSSQYNPGGVDPDSEKIEDK
jgi:hypothetical protein